MISQEKSSCRVKNTNNEHHHHLQTIILSRHCCVTHLFLSPHHHAPCFNSASKSVSLLRLTRHFIVFSSSFPRPIRHHHHTQNNKRYSTTSYNLHHQQSVEDLNPQTPQTPNHSSHSPCKTCVQLWPAFLESRSLQLDPGGDQPSEHVGVCCPAAHAPVTALCDDDGPDDGCHGIVDETCLVLALTQAVEQFQERRLSKELQREGFSMSFVYFNLKHNLILQTHAIEQQSKHLLGRHSQVGKS